VETLTFRNVDAARRFPLEPPQAPSQGRGEGHPCAVCGAPLARVLLTTYGPAGDLAVFRAYPLAVDALRCAGGEHFEYAFLSPQEVGGLQRAGLDAARAGDLDGAEFFFRRVVASWLDFALARLNLASVYLDRVRAAQRAGAPDDAIQRLVDVAEAQLGRARRCEPPPPPEADLMLARIWVRRGRLADARALLTPLADDPRARKETVDAAFALLDELDELESPRGSAGPASPPTIAHAYLRLALPAGWTRAEDDEGYFALFDGPGHEVVNVVVQELPAPCEVEAFLGRALAGHEASLRRNYPQCDAGPAIAFAAPAGLREQRRRFRVEGNGPGWTVFTRYVIAEQPITLGDGRRVHPYVQITHYGVAPLPTREMLDALGGASVLPMLTETAAQRGPETLVPYFVGEQHLARRDAALREAGRVAEGGRGLLPLARGAYLTVAIDAAEGAQPLFGADLAARGLDVPSALARAESTFARRLGGPDLPVRVVSTTPFAIPPIWREGMHAIVQGTDTQRLVVVGPGWLSASAAASGALFRHASEALGTRQLRALVPHRDRAFVFAAAADPRDNEALARGILRAEADGERRISDEIFVLEPGGLSPWGPSALQWTLLSTHKGATRAEIEARVPPDAEARWVTGQPGKRDELRFAHWRAPPFTVRYQFEGDALFGVVIFAAVRGDFEALRAVDVELRASLPDLELRLTGGVPWDLDRARPLVEHALSQKLPTGTPIMAEIPGFGSIFGKVFGWTEGDGRLYGFELRYRPGLHQEEG
jgi:hypothetical protein